MLLVGSDYVDFFYFKVLSFLNAPVGNTHSVSQKCNRAFSCPLRILSVHTSQAKVISLNSWCEPEV